MYAVKTPDATVDRWIAAFQPRPSARVRLLCFPHAGAGPSAFRRWSGLLPPEIDPCLLQLPGRENRLTETPFTELPPLLGALLDALEPMMRPPYALFGCSMGALVAFELARALRAAGRALPCHLFVAARQAPQLPSSPTPMDTLTDAELLEEIRTLNGTPQEILAHQELMRLILPTLRADLGVCERYRYEHQQALNCPISAFAALDDSGALPEAVSAWRMQTTSRFQLHLVDGGHFVLQTATTVVAGHVTADLLHTLGAVRG
jgi:surfactin synthase thioesterase subunit